MLDLYLTTDAARTHTSKPVASLPTDPDSLIHKAIQIYREESGRDIDLYKTTRIYPQDLTRLRAIVATMIPPN